MRAGSFCLLAAVVFLPNLAGCAIRMPSSGGNRAAKVRDSAIPLEVNKPSFQVAEPVDWDEYQCFWTEQLNYEVISDIDPIRVLERERRSRKRSFVVRIPDQIALELWDQRADVVAEYIERTMPSGGENEVERIGRDLEEEDLADIIELLKNTPKPASDKVFEAFQLDDVLNVRGDYWPGKDQNLGLVVFLNSAIATAAESAFVESLVQAGFSVLHVQMPAPQELALAVAESDRVKTESIESVESSEREAQLEEDATAEFRSFMSSYSAPFVVSMICEAYLQSSLIAVESLLNEILKDSDKGAFSSPISIVGFSYGGLAVPLLVSRNPDLFSAAIIGGAGTKPWREPVMTRILDIPLGDSKLIDDAILAMSPSVPSHHAAMLSNMPVLVINGSFDRVLGPRSTKDLCRLASYPERWVYPLGHYGLFLFMDPISKSAISWLEANLY